jgi:hypothetical protein
MPGGLKVSTANWAQVARILSFVALSLAGSRETHAFSA